MCFGAEAEVIFEYERTQDDELTLRVGEIVHNVKQVSQWTEDDGQTKVV